MYLSRIFWVTKESCKHNAFQYKQQFMAVTIQDQNLTGHERIHWHVGRTLTYPRHTRAGSSSGDAREPSSCVSPASLLLQLSGSSEGSRPSGVRSPLLGLVVGVVSGADAYLT